VDIAALCQFLANALRLADSFDLLVLKELVETLTGISITSDMSDEQVRDCRPFLGPECSSVARTCILLCKHLLDSSLAVALSCSPQRLCGPCPLLQFTHADIRDGNVKLVQPQKVLLKVKGMITSRKKAS